MSSEIILPIPAPTETKSNPEQAIQSCFTCIDLLSSTNYIDDPAINLLFTYFSKSFLSSFTDEKETRIKTEVRSGVKIHDEINEKGNTLVIPLDLAHRIEENGFMELCLLTRAASKLQDAYFGFANIPNNSFIEDRANAFEVQLIKDFQKITEKLLPLTPVQEKLLLNEKYKNGVDSLPFGVYYGSTEKNKDTWFLSDYTDTIYRSSGKFSNPTTWKKPTEI